ncbi:ABC transporter substrate-binding protein [Paenibacillus aurantiacus]|uniref:ABC transporter substrate-binding protein n=1 Tax=Paenibacillus aurantiacus TaxID=1936118 RepID=A0ABV5KYF6_9BACL
MKALKWSLPSVLSLSLLVTGCAGGNDSAFSMDEEEAGTLKVMAHDESWFFQQYGNLFNTKFPNVEIEVLSMRSLYGEGVTDYEKAFADFIEKEQPDVLMLSMDQYVKFAEENKLTELDAMLEEEDFKSADLLPAAVERMKEKGGGKLYGLSPFFYSQALFYNKDLFDKYGVPLPDKSLSWQEVFELAKRFPTGGDKKERVYGFSYGYGNLTNMGMMIGNTEGLRYIDPAATKISIHTDGWKRVYEMTLSAVKSGALYSPELEGNTSGDGSYSNYMERDKFLSGKAAMTMNGSYYMDELSRAGDYNKDYKPFTWGLLTEPVDPANPGTGTTLDLSEIYAVNAKAANPKAAWQLVKYINGDQAAKLLSRTQSGSLLTRTQYNKNKVKGDVNLEPFYALKPRESNDYNTNIPGEFYTPFFDNAEKELKAVQAGSQTLDEALQAIELSGQQALDKARKAQEAEKAKKAAESGGDNATSTDGNAGSIQDEAATDSASTEAVTETAS